MSRILVVDDDKSTCDLIRMRLENSYEILDTAGPEHALALALEHKPDAILLDLCMPGISGFEVCEALSAIRATRQIPVFIVTGLDTRNAAFCLNLGAKGFFQKPLDFARIRTALEQTLNRPNRRSEERFAMRVVLILRGTAKNGDSFEIRTVTENVSENGFLCVCSQTLTIGDSVEVYACGRGEHFIGIAEAVRSEPRADAQVHYGFRFVHKVVGKSLNSPFDAKTGQEDSIRG